MNKNDFLNEMLEEVKNLKDLAKEELPLVAQEYISAGRLSALLTFIAGSILLVSALGAALYAILGSDPDRYESLVFVSTLYSIIAGILGFILVGVGGDSLIDFYMQPRRMAIKAITSLSGRE